MLLANATKEAPLLLPMRSLRCQDRARIVLIAGWQMMRPQLVRKAQMKAILMLIVGLMLAGCGSIENHGRNRDEGARRSGVVHQPVSNDGEARAVDAICACP
jgi:hypothetical protein